MADLTLYHAAPSRSSIALWMLEEIGEPYDIKLVKLSEGDNLKPDYLADAFPDKKLNVPVGDPRRGPYLKWLFFGPGCFEPAVIDRAAPRKEPPRRAMLGYGDFDTTMNVVAKAVEQGPWILGEQFTAADVVIGANIRWGMMFKLVPERASFLDYAARIAARPAAQRAEAKDKAVQAP